MASVHAVRTLASVEAAARQAQRSSILDAVEARPADVAAVLLSNPSLVNGLRDLNEIVRVLLNFGCRDQVSRLVESKDIGARERKVILNQFFAS